MSEVPAEVGLAGFRQLRIVELGMWIAAPSAAALFADLGAEVIKVEPPHGDPGRAWFKSVGSDADIQPTFALDNRRKRSIALDLADPTDWAKLDALLETADVFITNLRLSALRKLKLDPETATAAHPRLVYGSITAYGLKGPDAELPGFDVGAFWARSGLSHQLAGASPLHAPGAYGDHVTGLTLFTAVLAGLLDRHTTGRGGVVETSLLQAGSWISGPDLAVYSALGRVNAVAPRGQAHTPLVNSYRTSDGRWFFLTCVDAMRHFQRVCDVIGQPELAADERFLTARGIRANRRELIAILDEAFIKKSLDEWKKRFDEVDIWYQTVKEPAEVLADPQLAANGWLEDVEVGPNHTVPMMTSPISVFGSRGSVPARAPGVGEDNEAILGGLAAEA